VVRRHDAPRLDDDVGGCGPIGEPARIRANFLLVVETLFPERVVEVERELRKAR
jgi:hypothetical protein